MSTQEMPRFKPRSKCAKCGSYSAQTRYKPSLEGYPHSPAPGLIEWRGAVPEYLARTCNYCGYEWKEAPLG